MSRVSFLLLSLTLSLLYACSQEQETLANNYDIIPFPHLLQAQDGQFILAANTRLAALGTNEEVKRMVNNFACVLRSKSGLSLPVSEGVRSAPISFGIDSAIDHPEAYELRISAESIEVKAGAPHGLFYAIQTLRQLLNKSAGNTWYFPAATIIDTPRFPYRGTHLDVARHFHPVETVKAVIDQLAYHKLNTFHWHLTEDHGWRIEIKAFPKLTEIGAYRNGTLIGHYNDQPHQFDGKRYGGFYTQEQIKEVVQYAADRYIEVIPEIELPGHALAALAAYAELGCDGGPYEVWQKWGISENVFCPTETTFEFLEKVFDEVTDLFPAKYIHIGGDECPKTKWKESAFCQQLMEQEGLKDEYELQSYFIRRIERYLNSKGKQIIGWDEILEGGLAPNATIMSWRGTAGGVKAAQAGHDVIMTPTSHCYLDYYQSDHPDEPLAIGGLLPLEKVYSYEPIPIELSPEQAEHVLGTQVNLWTEYIPTQEKLEYMLFPRLCASAEGGWSKDRDFSDFIERLIPHLSRLEEMGIRPANHLYDIESDVKTHEGLVVVDLQTQTKAAAVHYTVDGSLPTITDALYDGAGIRIDTSTFIQAQCFQAGKAIGRPWEQQVDWHLAAGQSLQLAEMPHPKYGSGGAAALINGINGSDERYGDAEWLGFAGKDCVATIDLGGIRNVSHAQFRFFKGEGQWIYLPKSIKVFASPEGKNFTLIGASGPIEGDSKVVSPMVSLQATSARYLKVEIANYGIIPEGKQGGGHPAWLFVDEIRVE